MIQGRTIRYEGVGGFFLQLFFAEGWETNIFFSPGQKDKQIIFVNIYICSILLSKLRTTLFFFLFCSQHYFFTHPLPQSNGASLCETEIKKRMTYVTQLHEP